MARRLARPIPKKGLIAAAEHVRRDTDSGPPLDFRIDPIIRRLVRPLAITLLATSLAIAFLAVITVISPGQPWGWIALLAFVIALEGTYTSAWLNNPDSRAIDRSIYRAAELLVIATVARIVSWIIFDGGLPDSAKLQTFLASPFSFFMVANYFTTLFVVFVSWWLSVVLSRIFTQLDISEEELRFYTLSEAGQKSQADNRPIQMPRAELQNQYMNLFLSIGMLLVVLTAFSTFEIRELTNVINPFAITRVGLQPGMLAALLLYFIIGLWLLSHARLLRMNARWLMDGVTRNPQMDRNWQRNSLFLIGLIAIAALFLPIGSTLGISRVLAFVLQGLTYLVSAVYGLFALFFASILAALSQTTEPIEQQSIEPLPTVPPPLVNETAVAEPLLGMLASSAFWAILIALIIGALTYFYNQRGYKLDFRRVRGYLATLTTGLQMLWQKIRHKARSTRRHWQRFINNRTFDQPTLSSEKFKSARRRTTRPDNLPPRELIRYYYISTVHQAAKQGIRREAAETPLEFSADLKENWPEAEAELNALTNAFLEARYNVQEIEDNEVNLVKDGWKRLNSFLKTPGRKNPLNQGYVPGFKEK